MPMTDLFAALAAHDSDTTRRLPTSPPSAAGKNLLRKG